MQLNNSFYEQTNENIDVSNVEFQKAYTLIEKTDQTFFLTGKAGTGKSTFLKYIKRSIKKEILVVAPTGIAAINANGATIHSVFQFPLRPLIPEDSGIPVFEIYSKKSNLIQSIETLIIDEVSMVRADLIDAVDYSLRKNGGNPFLPFGGKQVVFVGDIYQLEPVVNRSAGEKEIINEFYSSPYFFNAKVFEQFELKTIELKKVYRQSESEFIDILNNIREDKATNADLAKLNERCMPIEPELDFSITLTTKNDSAENVNRSRLKELNYPVFTFDATIEKRFEEKNYPTDKCLGLKVNSQVMFIKNDWNKRWVNGSIGRIDYLSENEIRVELENGEKYNIEREFWENTKYEYDKNAKRIKQEVIGTFGQYPLKLAWAISIHKSQGLSFDKVVVDFGQGTFSSGQAYVALSRVRTFNGLFLQRAISHDDIYLDERIKQFEETYNGHDELDEIIRNAEIVYTFKHHYNFEELGNYYFSCAFKALSNNNIGLFIKHLTKGFDNCTSDSFLEKYFKENDRDISNLIFPTNRLKCNSDELSLIEAIYFLYTKDYNKALNHIETFIEYRKDYDIGYFLMARILEKMDEKDKAINNYTKFLWAKKSAKCYYRLFHIYKSSNKELAVNYLIRSLDQNPSSIKALKKLHQVFTKCFVHVNTNSDKILVRSLNRDNTKIFVDKIYSLLEQGSLAFNGENIPAELAFCELQSALLNDLSKIKKQIRNYRPNKNTQIDDRLDGELLFMGGYGLCYLNEIPKLIPFKSGILWGYCNKDKKIIIAPKFSWVNFFINDLATVKHNSETRIIDTYGIDIFPHIKGDIYCLHYLPGKDFFEITIENKRKLIDRRGVEVFNYPYDNFIRNENSLFEIEKFGKSCFIDEDGHEYEDNIKGFSKYFLFTDDLCLIEKDGKFGLVDKAGRVILPCKYESINVYGDDKTFIRAKQNGLWGLVNRYGKTILPFEYDNISDWSKKENVIVKKNGKYGSVDFKGQIILDYIYSDLDTFNDGLAVSKAIYYYGYIDKSGKEIIPFNFLEAYSFDNGLAIVSSLILKDEIYDEDNDRSDDMSIYGLIDIAGNKISQNKYSQITEFYEGLAAVCNRYLKWGFINEKGDEVIHCSFSNVKYFSEGLVAVERHSRWGYINKNGEYIIPAKYSKASSFINGYAIVEDTWTFMSPGTYNKILIDNQGNEIREKVWEFNPLIGFGYCIKEDNYIYFNIDGTEYFV